MNNKSDEPKKNKASARISVPPLVCARGVTTQTQIVRDRPSTIKVALISLPPADKDRALLFMRDLAAKLPAGQYPNKRTAVAACQAAFAEDTCSERMAIKAFEDARIGRLGRPANKGTG